MTRTAALQLEVDEFCSSDVAPDDYVIAPNTAPKFGDDLWDLQQHVDQVSTAERRINFFTVPGGWRLAVRESLLYLARPDHPVVVDAGVIRRSTPTRVGGLIARFYELRAIAVWAAANNCSTPASWTAQTTRRFVDALERGRHREGGTPLSASAIRKSRNALAAMWSLNNALSEPKLRVDPVAGNKPGMTARYAADTENITNPIPWAGWSAIMRATTFVLWDLADDLIVAEQTRRTLPTAARQRSDMSPEEALDQFLAAGGRVPLHTGYGRHPRPRGELNRNLVARQLDLSYSTLNTAARGYHTDLDNRLERLASDPTTSIVGGLQPRNWSTEQIAGWNPELGPGEVEHLCSVLRGAAYLLLAALTGMRDSELQQLARGCITHHHGDLPALRSFQFKGEDDLGGRERLWFAPTPVFRAIEILERLSPHAELLFARSTTSGAYAPQRDIKRFLAFVNASSETRVGRGGPLPLDSIDTSGVSLNQQSMRRSFAVYAARYPGAELGLGLQLGHAALRMTAGYFLDSQERASRLVDDERRTVINDVVRSMIDGQPAAGGGAEHLRSFQATSVASPARARRLVEQLAADYHVGSFNDCHYRAALAACGSEGPQLGERRCGTSRCNNAVITLRHLPTWDAHIARIDHELGGDHLHPAFEIALRENRSEIAVMLRGLRDQIEQP